jgi:hypothetical protein
VQGQARIAVRTARILLGGLALSCITAGTGEAAKSKNNRPTPSLEQSFTSEQLKEDLKVLRQALEGGHPGLYLYTSKDAFDRRFDQANKTFDRPMTLRQFYLQVAPLVEKVYCGHTYFDLSPKLLKSLRKETALFPLPLTFLNKKAYLDHAKLVMPLGSQITAINGMPMGEILATLLPYVRSDGYNVTLKYRQMAEEFAMHYFLSFGQKEKFQIDYLPFGSEKKLSKEIQSIPAGKLEKILSARHSAIGKLKKYKLRPIEEGIQLFSMNSFDFGLNKKGRQKYKTFLRDNFATLEEGGKGCIILDLRQNDGGYVGNDAQLFSYFAQAHFRDVKSAKTKTLTIPVKEHLARNQFPKMLEKILAKDFKKSDTGRFLMLEEKNREWKPRKTAFDGHIYTLISGWTHSGGVVLCSFLLNNDNVTVIGEETGGGHATFTAGNMVLYDLPNTRCQLEVPLIRYESYRGGKAFPKGSGIRPDHKVVKSQKDLIASVDTVMEFALQLAQKAATAKDDSVK